MGPQPNEVRLGAGGAFCPLVGEMGGTRGPRAGAAPELLAGARIGGVCGPLSGQQMDFRESLELVTLWACERGRKGVWFPSNFQRLLHLEWRDPEVLLYGTGNYVQSLVMEQEHDGR